MPDFSIQNQLFNKKVSAVGSGSQSSMSELGLSDDYSYLYNANPNNNYNYQLGWWDKIGNLFGFRTKEDKYREEMQQRSRDYDSQLASLAFENDYNSDVSKVERMREAGLNPDLQGTSGVSEAAEMTEPTTIPNVPGGENPEIQSALSSVFQIGESLLGFAGQLGNVQSLFLGNKGKKLDLFNGYMNSASGWLLKLFDPDDLVGENADTSSFGIRPGSTGFGRRFEKQATQFMRKVTGSADYRKSLFSSLNSGESDAKSFFNLSGEHDGVYSMQALKTAWEPLGKCALSIQKIEQKYREEVAKFNEKYQSLLNGTEIDGLDMADISAQSDMTGAANKRRYNLKAYEINLPELQARADSGDAKAREALAEYEKTRKDMLNDINTSFINLASSFEKMSNDGNFFGDIGMMLMAWLRSKLMGNFAM